MKTKISEKKLFNTYRKLTEQINKQLSKLNENEKPIIKLALINFIKTK